MGRDLATAAPGATGAAGHGGMGRAGEATAARGAPKPWEKEGPTHVPRAERRTPGLPPYILNSPSCSAERRTAGGPEEPARPRPKRPGAGRGAQGQARLSGGRKRGAGEGAKRKLWAVSSRRAALPSRRCLPLLARAPAPRRPCYLPTSPPKPGGPPGTDAQGSRHPPAPAPICGQGASGCHGIRSRASEREAEGPQQCLWAATAWPSPPAAGTANTGK